MPLTVIAWLILYFGGIWNAFTRHPVWGLWTYTLVLYASPGHNWWGEFLPNLRWSLLASIFAFLSIYMNRDRLVPKASWISNGAAKILIAYTIWMWIQLPWALSYEIHIGACILYTKYIVLFYIIYTVLDDEKSFFYFILFNILGGFYWGKLILDYSVRGRVEGIGGPGVDDANTLGMHLSVVVIFAAMMLLKKNTIFSNPFYWKVTQGVIFLAALFMAHGVVQSISRSAVLGLVAAGMVIIWLKHKAFRKKIYIYFFLAAIGFLALTPYTFWERLETVQDAASGEEIEGSAYSRIVVAKAQLEMFKENVMGHGHRGTAVLSPYYLPAEYLTSSTGFQEDAVRSSHCTFLTTLVEQGIPGAILYCMMVFWVIKIIHSFRKDDIIIYLYVMTMAGSLTAIFVSGIFVDYLKVEIQIYCFAMLATLKEWERIRTLSAPLKN